MADTTVRVDVETSKRLAALAAGRGMSVRAYLAELALHEENQRKLGRATAAFDAALSRPGVMDAFDERYGGAPTEAREPRRRAA